MTGRSELVCRRNLFGLVLVGLLMGLTLLTAAGPAAARAKRVDFRCCFQATIQGGGIETVDYGDGMTPPYTSYRGKYFAGWSFAFRMLMKVSSFRGKYYLDPMRPYRFVMKHGRQRVVLHDWIVQWGFDDTPQNVQLACCFTQHPHGWQPACSTPNASIGDENFVQTRFPTPDLVRYSSELTVSVADPTPRAGFVCGLNDGRLDAPLHLIWHGRLGPPSEKWMRHGIDFAENCSNSASETGDGRNIKSSTGTTQVRVRIKFFDPSDLYKTAQQLDGLDGTKPPGFSGPPATPNQGATCVPG